MKTIFVGVSHEPSLSPELSGRSIIPFSIGALAGCLALLCQGTALLGLGVCRHTLLGLSGFALMAQCGRGCSYPALLGLHGRMVLPLCVLAVLAVYRFRALGLFGRGVAGRAHWRRIQSMKFVRNPTNFEA